MKMLNMIQIMPRVLKWLSKRNAIGCVNDTVIFNMYQKNLANYFRCLIPDLNHNFRNPFLGQKVFVNAGEFGLKNETG